MADTRCAYSTGQAQAFAQAFRAGADRITGAAERQLRLVLAHRAAWLARARAVLR